MKKLLISMVFLSFFTFSKAQMMELDVSKTNKDFFKAMATEDFESLDKIFHEEYYLIFVGGDVFGGDIMVQGVKNNYARFDLCETEKDEVVSFGNTVIVSGLWKLKGRIRDNEVEENMIYSNTFIKENDDWKLVRTQVTVIPK